MLFKIILEADWRKFEIRGDWTNEEISEFYSKLEFFSKNFTFIQTNAQEYGLK